MATRVKDKAQRRDKYQISEHEARTMTTNNAEASRQRTCSEGAELGILLGSFEGMLDGWRKEGENESERQR